MKQAMIQIFNKWIHGPAGHYHISDYDVPLPKDEKPLEHRPLNPFIHNDADVRIKFGGFLEQELLTNYERLTVHSELALPRDSVFPCFPDLSIHAILGDLSSGPNGQKLCIETVRAAIKVRFIDHLASRNRTYDSTDFHTDFACLNELPGYADRFLLIIDEGESMDSAIIDELRNVSKQFEVSILSNNDWLASENF